MALLWAYLITGNKSPKLIQVLVPFFMKWCQSLKNCWRKGKQWPCHQTWKIKYQASFVQLLIYSRAPWASKSTHPRKFGTHVTVHRTNNRPSASQAYQWKSWGSLWLQWEFWIQGTRLFFWREKEWSPRFVKHKQLRSSAKATQNKKKLFFSYRLTEIFLHSYFLEFSFIVSSSLEYRERERKSKRESRRQASQTQRERERERATERRRNWTDEQRKTEQERNRERRSNFTDEPWEREQEGIRECRRNFTDVQQEGERERIREWRCNVTGVQQEREQERIREWRQNFTDKEWAKEQERTRERRHNFTEEQLEN